MPEALRDHAVSQLRYIRDTMERAASFTAIPGRGGFIVGTIALITTIIAAPLASTAPPIWLAAWLICAVVSAAIGWSAMAWKAKRAGVSLVTGVARRFLVAYFAPILAGAALTFALWLDGAYRPMPAAWLLLYGASFVSSGAFSLRFVPVMGASFMACGIVAAFVPLTIAHFICGAAFALLHIGFGLFIARNYGG